MPRPGWDDEHKDMHVTCETNASGRLAGSESAFLNRTKNKDDLTKADKAELMRLWHKVRETL